MAHHKPTAHYLLRRLGNYHSKFLGALMSLAMYLCWGYPPSQCIIVTSFMHLCSTFAVRRIFPLELCRYKL